MEKKDIQEKLEKTLNILKNEDFLISENSNERSITHQFASILQFEFPEHHVDCEYNRMMDEEGRQQIKKVYENPDEVTPVNDLDAKTVYPDIIVHRREDGEHNLLVIEAKKSSVDTTNDRKKLNVFMSEKNNGGLGYDFSALVVFDVENPKNSRVKIKDSSENWE